jgi:hypothetical protein
MNGHFIRLISIIPTWEAEIGELQFKTRLGKNVSKTLSQRISLVN